MREFLVNFLSEFEYEKEDKECLISAFDKVMENKEASWLFWECISMYEQDINIDYWKEIIENRAQKLAPMVNIHTYTIELLVFICMAKHLKKLYIERNIDLEIYKNSMYDLKYKLDECKLVKGICGSFVAGWFPGFYNLTRFALGRLQFELCTFDKSYEKDGKSLKNGDTVINVHIPRSLKPLTKESCDEAYAMAAEFFKDKINNPIAFVCYSWLLYSPTFDILPEGSNTKRFVAQFDILSDNHHPEGQHHDAWRLFDMDYTGNAEDLPGNTSMRRAFKEYIKAGNKTGEGYGVFFA